MFILTALRVHFHYKYTSPLRCLMKLPYLKLRESTSTGADLEILRILIAKVPFKDITMIVFPAATRAGVKEPTITTGNCLTFDVPTSR